MFDITGEQAGQIIKKLLNRLLFWLCCSQPSFYASCYIHVFTFDYPAENVDDRTAVCIRFSNIHGVCAMGEPIHHAVG